MKQKLTKEMTEKFAPLRQWADSNKDHSIIILAGNKKEFSVNMQGDFRNIAELLANCFDSDKGLLQASLLAVVAINKNHQKKQDNEQ